MGSIRVRRAAVAAMVGVAALLMSGCGIPMQDEPQPLPSGAVPDSIASAPAAQQ